MNLFDEKKRDYKGPANLAEPTWDYFDRSALQEVGCIRATLNAWFQLVPACHQHEIKRSFQSGFEAAFFELYLLRMLTNLGYEVTIHPSVPDTGCKPDFYAIRGDLAFFLEATVARDESDEEKGQRAVENRLYDYLDDLTSPYFFPIVQLEIEPGVQPAAKRVKAFLKRELEEITPDLPPAGKVLRFRDDGVLIDFQPIPKPSEIRDDPTKRNIGLYPMETRCGGMAGSIRSSLLNKSTRYGDLRAPYVVAVNIASKWFYDWPEVVDALFGGLTLDTGVWRGPNGRPQNTRLSAVLASLVCPWSMGNERPKLFQNPKARFPLLHNALPVDLWPPDGTFAEGLSPSELVGVAAGWPIRATP